MTATVTCPTCGRTMPPGWIDDRWRGLLPWHKTPGTVVTCPGTERWTPTTRPGQGTQGTLPLAGG